MGKLMEWLFEMKMKRFDNRKPQYIHLWGRGAGGEETFLFEFLKYMNKNIGCIYWLLVKFYDLKFF
jgi:hypothetical protein